MFKSLIILALFVCSASVHGQISDESIPVRLVWPAALTSDTFRMQVSRSPTFGAYEYDEPAPAEEFVWSAPGPGVFHWRILRSAEAGAEGNTVMSGSFVAVLPVASEKSPAKIRWDAVDGANRYHLYVWEGGTRERLMVTSATMFLVPRLGVPLMIRVEPFHGGARVERTWQLNPSLELEMFGLPQQTEVAANPTPPPAVANPPAPVAEPEQIAMESDKPATDQQDEASVPEDPPQVETTVEETQDIPDDDPAYVYRRVHLLYAGLFYVDEWLRAQKLEIDVVSQMRMPGFQAGLWLNPVPALVVSADASYHVHQATLDINDVTSSYEVDQTRITGIVSFGWNVLSLLSDPVDQRRHLLTLSVSSGLSQFPRLPLEFDGSPGVVPALSANQAYLYGGSASYGYFGYEWSAMLEGGLVVQKQDDVRLSWQRLVYERYFTQVFALRLAALARVTSTKSCHENAGTCLREGKVRTGVKEVGASIGAGFVLY